MTIAQMRELLAQAYPGSDWPYKVKRMKDSQVLAVYNRLMNDKKL